jgi:hypothetical protein
VVPDDSAALEILLGTELAYDLERHLAEWLWCTPIGDPLCSSETTQDNIDVLFVQTLRRLEFAQGQRNWTAGGTDGWREPAEDAHKQSENDAAGEESRRDAEGECQV